MAPGFRPGCKKLRALESISVKSLDANSRLLHLLALNKCSGSSAHRWGQLPGLEKEGYRTVAWRRVEVLC